MTPEQKVTINLYLCPFCGGTPKITRLGTSQQSSIITCTNCGAKVESNEQPWSTGMHWNSRSIEISCTQDLLINICTALGSCKMNLCIPVIEEMKTALSMLSDACQVGKTTISRELALNATKKIREQLHARNKTES